jgi:hypothetical protein
LTPGAGFLIKALGANFAPTGKLALSQCLYIPSSVGAYRKVSALPLRKNCPINFEPRQILFIGTNLNLKVGVIFTAGLKRTLKLFPASLSSMNLYLVAAAPDVEVQVEADESLPDRLPQCAPRLVVVHRKSPGLKNKRGRCFDFRFFESKKKSILTQNTENIDPL